MTGPTDAMVCTNCGRARAIRSAVRCTYCGGTFAHPGAPAAADASQPSADSTQPQGEASQPGPRGRPAKPQYVRSVPNLYADGPPPKEGILPSWLRGAGGVFAFFVFIVLVLFFLILWTIKKHVPESGPVEPGSLKGEFTLSIPPPVMPPAEERAPRPRDPMASIPPVLQPVAKGLAEYAKRNDAFPSRLSPGFDELVPYADVTAAREALRGGTFTSYRVQRMEDGTGETWTMTAVTTDGQVQQASGSHSYREATGQSAPEREPRGTDPGDGT